MTLVHKRSDFQSKVELRGSTLSAYAVRVRAGIELAGKKDEELIPSYVSSLSNYDESDKAALNEVLFMDDDEKKQEDVDIKSRLEELTFKKNKHIPNVPDEVIAKGCEDKYQHYEPDDYDINDIKSSFPSLDESTIVALMKRSNFDLRPGSMMIVLGDYFASSWDYDELKKLAETQFNYMASNKLIWSDRSGISSKSHSELVAEITDDFMQYISCGSSIGYHDMEHTAGLVRKLSFEELKKIGHEEGVSVEADDTRSSLIVKIVQHIYADVLELEGKEEKSTAREAKKPRTE